MKGHNGQAGRVLVVDDNSALNKLMCMVLQSSYTVTGVKSAAEAFSIIKSQPLPDLIVLDYNLPGVNGLEFLKFLRSNSLYNEIPILFISGEASESLTSQMLLFGELADKGGEVTVTVKDDDIFLIAEKTSQNEKVN